MKPSLNTATVSGSIALRNQIIAAALLAFIFCTVVAAALVFAVDPPYAFALGVIAVALVKVDDARIRRSRRQRVLTS